MARAGTHWKPTEAAWAGTHFRLVVKMETICRPGASAETHRMPAVKAPALTHWKLAEAASAGTHSEPAEAVWAGTHWESAVMTKAEG